ncbi:hypothetical protein ABZV67_21710 [Streptomyces sp. NPDC005065]|uniref:hypothetical protein n=1 Tax=Streptomyces sp. NPDC005065 TaxID=3154461 RepID=UPI0033AD6463
MTSDDVNAHLLKLSGCDLTSKDFRTWHATVLETVALAVSAEVMRDSKAARKRAASRAVREVAAYVGNTPTVCRSSCINPRLFELFEQGTTIASALGNLGASGEPGLLATQGPLEAAVRAADVTGGVMVTFAYRRQRSVTRRWPPRQRWARRPALIPVSRAA